ncbi:MAG TPA: acido-empty-quinoprotein group A [Bryobacteraceae bacterium]|jgi:alcohol dehydrogenase (cytochrome c)|nr:acido-empty-quinoprotein group A [Bryobacteraceae bacterium]
MRTALILTASALTLAAQGLDPTALLKPPTDAWPTYNGDYSGRRYSTLDQINKDNVHSLSLAWSFQTHSQPLKTTPLEVGGVLYFTVPDQVWAIDARSGRQIWHFQRPSQGNHIGNRGVAMYKDRLYLGTPDAHIISLSARDGKQLWDVEIADSHFGYYISVAPLAVKDEIVIGTSGDQADVAHSVIALDADSGKEKWRFHTLPEAGSAAAKTWPNQQALAHGGAAAWVTATYDPSLNLIFVGTGNPHPVLAGVARPGANLYTCSILALNADTGKLVWYYQPSPHDTHDWDAVETPVIFDAEFNGATTKLLAQASRNGYFFLLDRTTGEHLLTTPFVPVNWAKGLDAQGQPISNPATEPQPDGALINSFEEGGTNWNAPSFDPQTGLFYVNAQTGYSLYYLALTKNGNAEGHQGGNAVDLWSQGRLIAIDYKTGKPRWIREEEEAVSFPGILTTAGHLLFTADVTGNILALDAETGGTLWHSYGGGMMNSSPMTYQIDGRQYVLTAVDSVLYAWALPRAE